MLLPSTRAWTSRQKGIIVGLALVGIVLTGAGIYTFERYYRGPGENALVGSWESTGSNDVRLESHFYSDRTCRMAWDSLVIQTGHWYAGGKNIYLCSEEPDSTRLYVCEIDDLTSNQLRIHFPHGGWAFILKRSNPAAPNASI